MYRFYSFVQIREVNAHNRRRQIRTQTVLNFDYYLSRNLCIYAGRARANRTKSSVNPAASKSHYDYLDFSAKRKKDKVVAGLNELIEARRGA